MNTAKSEVASMLETLPDNSSLEDIQYHLQANLAAQPSHTGFSGAFVDRISP